MSSIFSPACLKCVFEEAQGAPTHPNVLRTCGFGQDRTLGSSGLCLPGACPWSPVRAPHGLGRSAIGRGRRPAARLPAQHTPQEDAPLSLCQDAAEISFPGTSKSPAARFCPDSIQLPSVTREDQVPRGTVERRGACRDWRQMTPGASVECPEQGLAQDRENADHFPCSLLCEHTQAGPQERDFHRGSGERDFFTEQSCSFSDQAWDRAREIQ